jgi:hypothetical protein
MMALKAELLGELHAWERKGNLSSQMMTLPQMP